VCTYMCVQVCVNAGGACAVVCRCLRVWAGLGKCRCVFIHVCTYTFLQVCLCAGVYRVVCVRACACVHVQTCVGACADVVRCMCMQLCVCVCICTCVYVGCMCVLCTCVYVCVSPGVPVLLVVFGDLLVEVLGRAWDKEELRQVARSVLTLTVVPQLSCTHRHTDTDVRLYRLSWPYTQLYIGIALSNGY
jgi:hypothetical protein